MCEPTTIAIVAGLVISAAATGYTAYEADQTTKNNNHFQEEMSKQGTALATANFKNQANAENYRQSQADQAASQTKVENQKRAAQAKATAAVASGEAGVSGVSIDALQQDFNRQEAMFTNSVDTNRTWQRAQSASNLDALRAGATDRIASLTPNLQQSPGYLGAALRIGGQGLDTYNSYYRPYQSGSTTATA